ncbi:pre-B-cell leukemia transcription factor-interacting protein 1 isoform X1 [Pleuronectes platessa]|uniref:pre-B-cell leukemia transcription factor-interacting protein 1 isoform X1 n=1 Tax=Pleuronectes platessa TaxID=8262 RepID=UPI00232A0858|nr:pre-B-cell leukemia transcription factor-interacting protein 1 isoform X1 [Pleuronectes platessa]XP_053302177.1 pre-B-cell leukemia transcription factor-interacting protein 1 isoform X1 [Pleuronectes platessa]XP_053302178.1 pre-B-cell leukemia transcription factor-interacting protein 1 isoform X1 [Pleuronectes platessa]
MSDHSSSTGSSSSSTNSWTLLSPEDAAVENVGPVDDGTESLGDVASLSEELAGAAVEFRPIDILVETVLSEEGHQVCQETSPESSEGPIPSSPVQMSPLPHDPLDPLPDLDMESQAPVIHEIDTSSPCSDNELLGATPFVTSMDMEAQLDIIAAELPPSEFEESCSAAVTDLPVSANPTFDTPADVEQDLVSPAEESPDFDVEPEVNFATETITAINPPSHVHADVSFAPVSTELPSPAPESLVPEEPVDESPAPETVGSVEAEEPVDESPVTETVGSVEAEEPVDESPAPETVGSVEAEEEAAVEEEATETWETGEQEGGEEEEEDEPSTSFGDTSGFDDGVRRRNIPTFEGPRSRTSDEDDEDEEVEFKLPVKEEKPWLSMNKCIVGALILLFLGSLFLSGLPSDLDYGDFDASDLSDGEQSQDWLSGDPQDMKELLDKLTQENQHIALLEAQLQSQKEEMDSALKSVSESGDEQGKADLEQENANLKEELSSLPELKKELESLRARVTELNQLTVDQKMPPATPGPAPQPGVKDGQSDQKAAEPERRNEKNEGGKLKQELQRQKVLLEESRKRLEGMKKHGGGRKHVTDSLEEIQKKLSEQVERWGKKKPQDSKWKGNKGKNVERDHWKKEEKKEWRGEKEWKQGKEGGWKEKDEKKKEEWKPQKQNSHKEAWRKHQDEWEKKKDERRVDREDRRKEKPWHTQPSKKSHNHNHNHHNPQHQHHQSRQTHQYNQNEFWRDQEQKLRRNFKPQLGCTSVDNCASKEGLYAVELPEFEELLEGYLSKLEGSVPENKDKIRKLTAEFFEDGVFVHDRVRFSDFAEDVADVLEDMVDVLEGDGQKDNDSLEEEMEEFEREALWKFAATA